MGPTDFPAYSQVQILRRWFGPVAVRLVYTGAEVGHQQKSCNNLGVVKIHGHNKAWNAYLFVIEFKTNLFSEGNIAFQY